MPRSTAAPAAGAAGHRGRSRAASISGQAVDVGGGVDVAGPHDDGVLARLGVVVLPDPHGGEAEAAVERLGGGVAHPDLEGQVTDPEPGRGAGEVEEQDRPDTPVVPGGIDGQGGDVALVPHDHQSRVADDDGPDGCPTV